MLIYDKQEGKIYHGHVLDVLRSSLPSKSVNCCITSPPYWGLRDYGLPDQIWGGLQECDHDWGDKLPAAKESHTNENWSDYALKNYRGGGHKITEQAKNRPDNSGKFCQKCEAWAGSLGLEPTPELFVEHIVEIFREVRRVLRDDGTLWLNLGDSYNGYMANQRATSISANNQHARPYFESGHGKRTENLKPKDMVGIPWRVAFALQSDGWVLRQDIIWHKPNPMPESVKDRCTKAHDYIFLLSKNQRYYYDYEAIKEPASPDTHARYARGRSNNHKWADGGPGNQTIAKSFEHMRKPNGWHNSEKYHGEYPGKIPGVNPKAKNAPKGCKQNASFSAATKDIVENRNKRSVWTVSTKPFSGAHFATFPPDLIRPCILAGCPEGGVVVDPFFGAGTTGLEAYNQDRKFIGIDLSGEYLRNIAIPRIEQETQQLKLFR